MNFLEIEELFELLRLTDIRSVRAWCKKNGVLIIKQGKSEFVIESEFQMVLEQPFIMKLKGKFGSNWEQVYNLYKDGNIPALNNLSQSTTVPQVLFTTPKKDCRFTQKIKEYERRKKNAV